MLFELTNPEIAILMMSLFLFAVLLGFPIAFTLLAIQGISEVFRAIICIRTGHWPARLSADAEETEKVLMRTSQKDEKADVI